MNLATLGKCLSSSVALQPQQIYAPFDIGQGYPDFTAMWDGGAMDGASNEFYTQGSRSCTNNVPAPFAYIDNSSSTSPTVQILAVLSSAAILINYREWGPYLW